MYSFASSLCLLPLPFGPSVLLLNIFFTGSLLSILSLSPRHINILFHSFHHSTLRSIWTCPHTWISHTCLLSPLFSSLQLVTFHSTCPTQTAHLYSLYSWLHCLIPCPSILSKLKNIDCKSGISLPNQPSL